MPESSSDRQGWWTKSRKLRVLLAWTPVLSVLTAVAGAQPTIQEPQLSPVVVQVGTVTNVVIQAKVMGASSLLIPTSVTAVLQDPAIGPSVIGLFDDGVSPDAQAGDGIYTGVLTVQYPVSRAIDVIATAAINGELHRIASPATPLYVVESSATVGEKGGQISVAAPSLGTYGTRVTVPAGALAAATVVGVAAGVPSPPSPVLAAGPALSIVPSQLSFAQPVIVDLFFHDDDGDGIVDGTPIPVNSLGVFTSEDGNTWSEIPVVSQSNAEGRVTFFTNHTSFYMLGTTTCCAAFWNFDSADQAYWDSSDSSYNPPVSSIQSIAFGAAAPGSGDGQALQLRTRGHSEDRIKVFSTHPKNSNDLYGDGTYTWRVFVPSVHKGDSVSTGAFLLGSLGDCKVSRQQCVELDFEVGYGAAADRVGVSDALVLVFLTTQGAYRRTNYTAPGVHAVAGICQAGLQCSAVATVTPGDWHLFTLHVRKTATGTSDVDWFIDQIRQFSVTVNYDTVPLRVYNSLENLSFIGDKLPDSDTVAYFDRLIYTPEALQYVTPASLANIEGNSANCFLICWGNTERFQQVISKGEVPYPLVIKAIAFRPDANVVHQAASTVTIPNLRVMISSTTAPVDGLSTTFDKNLGSDALVVYSGPWTVSTVPNNPAAGPNKFDIILPFDVPFSYDPAAGKNLIFDFETITPPAGQPALFFDAQDAFPDGVSHLFRQGMLSPDQGVQQTAGVLINLLATLH